MQVTAVQIQSERRVLSNAVCAALSRKNRGHLRRTSEGSVQGDSSSLTALQMDIHGLESDPSRSGKSVPEDLPGAVEQRLHLFFEQ
jgi:hypothetical protein